MKERIRVEAGDDDDDDGDDEEGEKEGEETQAGRRAWR